MTPERLFNHVKDVALTLGEWALYQIRDLETPPQAASITHYGVGAEPAQPDFSKQLAFHQQQLLQGLPEAMQAHHLDMVNRLGKAA